MTNPTSSTPIRLWASNPPLEMLTANSQNTHSSIDIDGKRTPVSSAVFEWNRKDLYNWLLERNEITTPFASVALYCYRVNFGDDPPDFKNFISALPNDHIWNLEYAVANLAWNIPRLNNLLDQIPTSAYEIPNDIFEYLFPIMVGMNRLETVPEVEGLEMDFLSIVPVELISWPQTQLETILFTPEHNHTHQTWFHSGRRLRCIVNELGKRVKSGLNGKERKLIGLPDEPSREDSPLRGQASKETQREEAKPQRLDKGSKKSKKGVGRSVSSKKTGGQRDISGYFEKR